MRILRPSIPARLPASRRQLTMRPTRVAEILPYADARPRTVETLSEPSFTTARKRSLEIFQRAVRR